jgi:hypothetical protein
MNNTFNRKFLIYENDQRITSCLSYPMFDIVNWIKHLLQNVIWCQRVNVCVCVCVWNGIFSLCLLFFTEHSDKKKLEGELLKIFQKCSAKKKSILPYWNKQKHVTRGNKRVPLKTNSSFLSKENKKSRCKNPNILIACYISIFIMMWLQVHTCMVIKRIITSPLP